MQASPVTGTANLAFSANAVRPSVNDTAIGRTGDVARANRAPLPNPPRPARQRKKPATAKVSQGEAIESNGETLSEAELRELERLKQTDQEIRRHEMAHQVAGGADTAKCNSNAARTASAMPWPAKSRSTMAPVRGDPRATIDKMQRVISAALAGGPVTQGSSGRRHRPPVPSHRSVGARPATECHERRPPSRPDACGARRYRVQRDAFAEPLRYRRTCRPGQRQRLAEGMTGLQRHHVTWNHSILALPAAEAWANDL
ncbi:hypothetical protein DSL92_05295 [Billgrantia gudaonensis]|uniref:Uncharacterized protein n=1 Tax=Billgrantia gudaonensis TaxID=376427 RepID=A0A3S0NWZ3_9GAMM|nr:hypothetical protein DSL92_05295 [Halomonas gudaonensis]